MVTKLTQGVKISVETFYLEEHSHPEKGEFFHKYKITIENYRDFSIQLLSRKWIIFDSSGLYSEVEGEGVVGFQPVIEPGTFYCYESSCNLSTDFGSMHGFYVMKNLDLDTSFNVEIPVFLLTPPYKLN